MKVFPTAMLQETKTKMAKVPRHILDETYPKSYDKKEKLLIVMKYIDRIFLCINEVYKDDIT